ncbi:MAG: nucleoside recognition domain-containing protein [Candidatus Syntropharchaeales archaeon]
MDAVTKWVYIDKIIERTVEEKEGGRTLLKRIDDLTLNPYINLGVTFVILYLIFESFIRIGHVFLTERVIGRYIFAPGTGYDRWLHQTFEGTPLFEILVGDTAQGYLSSFGLLTTGLYVPFGVVLPSILIFYLWLTLLEDIGYLPRVAILAERLFARIGLPGTSIIPTILGLGCNVPGVIASRMLETQKERFILSNLLAIAVPCNAQISIALVVIGGVFGAEYLIIILAVLILLYLILGVFLKRTVAGKCPELILEVPPCRMVHLGSFMMKMHLRMRAFLFDAVPWVLAGVLLVNLLYLTGVLQLLEDAMAPILTLWFGIPPEMVGALIVGFLRKDVAIALLHFIPDLGVWQAITGVIILMIYFPCAATFLMLFKEQGIVNTLKSTALMIMVALIAGGVLNAARIIFGWVSHG